MFFKQWHREHDSGIDVGCYWERGIEAVLKRLYISVLGLQDMIRQRKQGAKRLKEIWRMSALGCWMMRSHALAFTGWGESERKLRLYMISLISFKRNLTFFLVVIGLPSLENLVFTHCRISLPMLLVYVFRMEKMWWLEPGSYGQHWVW